MTAFFVPEVQSHGEPDEAAYDELRKLSQSVVGHPARRRRILKLSCRVEGRDWDVEVGRPLFQGTAVVVAILDHGREEPFVVHTAAGTGAPVRVKRPVYSVTEFS